MIESYMGPTHPRAGSNPERQSVGLPGHCALCAEHGHAAAHPDLGCGDVGCSAHHDEPPSGLVVEDPAAELAWLRRLAAAHRQHCTANTCCIDALHLKETE